MVKRPMKSADKEVRTLQRRSELLEKLAARAAGAGEHSTEVPGLMLYSRTSTTACYRAAYEPSITIFAQGRKRIILGETEYLCNETSFLLSSIDVPAQSQIVAASEQKPLLALYLRLDLPTVREVLGREELHLADTAVQGRGIAVGETSLGMLDASVRMMDLLDNQADIPFFSLLLQREFIYRILQSPQGTRLRAIATAGEASHRTARAIAWLRANFKKPLRLEELAAAAHMGVSTLHHHFREITAMSPLQYQKQLRLQTARQHMLMDSMDATTAAYEVGYESVSQFSREYGRFFGQPPIRDIKAIRAASMSAEAAA